MMCHGAGAAPPEDHLVLYLPFDEGNGAVSADPVSGAQVTLTGAFGWTEGKLGQAVSFTGGAAGVDNSDPLNLSLITAMAWVNPTTITANIAPNHFTDIDPIYEKRGAGDDSVVLGLTGGDGIHFYVDIGADRNLSVPDAGVQTDEWQHVAGTFDGTTSRVYLNGEQIAEMAVQGTIITNTNQATMGGRSFRGALDEVRVYDRALTPEEIVVIIQGVPIGASAPRPSTAATDVPRDVKLSWTAGSFAASHDVYFGTAFGDVSDASRAEGRGVLVGQGEPGASFDPDRLEFDQTYYWRVDEVNSAPDFTIFPGDVWSFTTEPFAIPISDISVTASGSFGTSVAENTINGSGMTGDLHGTLVADMWISTGVPASLEFAFDRAYKLYELWIWNSNQIIEPFIGFGAKDVVIEHSLDGENWTVLEGVSALAQAPGTEGYAHNNTIDFGGAKAQHVRVNINTVQGFAPQASLSEVRFLYIPTFPTGPSPVSGATDVAADVMLSWDRDGREAGRHDIYLGSDPSVLSLAGSVTESSFDTLAADLALGQTYYWQVVEVNEAMDPSEWAGDIWSFTTVRSIAIDDMENYRDEEFLEIWATWIDGFDDPGNNGAVVGAVPALGDFSPETERVYGGSQSLPIHFDNSGVSRSEAMRTFDVAMDWGKHGVQSLVLFFGGSPANTGGQLYVKINDTKVSYDGAASDLMHLGWNKWAIPLSSVSASTLSRVQSLTIGIEGNASGVVYVDEIQLTEDARVVVTPTEPSTEALVAHYAFDGDASDSLGQSPGTLFGETSFVPGVNGQALRLDGINAYVAIDGLFYDSTGLPEVTVTAWIRTDIEDNQIIASFDRNEYWRLEINGDGGGPGQVGWDMMTDAGQIDYGSSSRVDDNEWHHVAGVFDNGTATIYIDGYHEPPARRGSTFGTGNTRFGYVGLGSESTTFNADPRTPTSFFIGDLDDVRIYQRALSAAEVAGMAGRTEPFEKP